MDIQLKKRRFPISRKTITIIAIAAGVASRRYCGATRRSVGNESGEGVAAHRRRDARSV